MKHFLVGLVLNMVIGGILFILFIFTPKTPVQPNYKVYYEYNVYRQYIKLNSGYYKVIADTIPVDTVYVEIK